MAKQGTLPHYLFSNKIGEVTETTEAYSVHMGRSSDLKNKVPDVAEQHKVPKVESTEARASRSSLDQSRLCCDCDQSHCIIETNVVYKNTPLFSRHIFCVNSVYIHTLNYILTVT